MAKEFFFLSNLNKSGYSFIIRFYKGKVFFAEESCEFELVDPDKVLEVVTYEYMSDRISLIGVL